MIKLTNEYLSILQCFLYKAQKRQKIKQLLKLQTIFYKSKSLIYFLLRYKNFKNDQRNKIQFFLSEPIFKNFYNVCILKKQIQISFFLNSEFQLKKNLSNFLDNFSSFYSFPLFYNSKKKQIFSINLLLGNPNMKLSYLSFYNNSMNFNLNSLRNRQFNILSRFTYYHFSLSSSKLKEYNIFFLLFDIHNKKNIFSRILKKVYFKLETKYPLFKYQMFYDFYFDHHHYFVDSKKIQYQNHLYFSFLSKKKQGVFMDNQQRKENIKKSFLNYKNTISKNYLHKYNEFGFSTILNYPYFRQNGCFFYSQLLRNLVFKNFQNIKFLEIRLNNIQKQILLFIFEPIWEAFFEISSYSSRKGRSLYDAIEFLRFTLKKQPMFVFKIYLNFFYKMIYQKIEKKRTFKNTYTHSLSKIQKKPIISNKFNLIYNKKQLFLLFSNFIENIFFYGIQKKNQNSYLRTKQQIFLYQILKILKQNNKKKDIYFYKVFYNNYFYILTIQHTIQIKSQNKKLITTSFTNNFKKNIDKIRYYRKFIIESFQNFNFDQYKNKINNYTANHVLNFKLGNYKENNFIIFTLSTFLQEKINDVKQKLFSIQLKKQKFSFYLKLKNLSSNFLSLNNNLSKKKESFSMIFKDSNFFVSKNTFLLFFIKNNKKVFLNLLNYWNKENDSFLKKRKNNSIVLKKVQYQMTINKLKHVFVFSTIIFPSCCNFKKLLKINLFFTCSFFNSLNQFLNLESFDNISLIFLLFIKNIFFSLNLLKKSCSFININFFFLMYYSNFCGKFFSFFRYNLKKIFIVFLLKINDVKIIWKFFLNYGNFFLHFNSNYFFLKTFQIFLKKWIIFNKIMLFFYIENNNKVNSSTVATLTMNRNFKAFNENTWIIFDLKYLLNEIVLQNFHLTNILNQRINFQKYFHLDSLWFSKLFLTKEKHTFYVYKKNINGLYFLNFFMFHKKKNNTKFVFNSIFFWQFYFIKSLQHFKYIQSFLNYYEIYYFISHKVKKWKTKQIKQKLQFYFFQSLFLHYRSNYTYILQYKNLLQKLIFFSFENQREMNSFSLFNVFFSQLIKDDSKFLLYKKLIQQQKLKLYFHFSIKPSKYHIQKHLVKIQNIVQKCINKKQEYVIFKLSKSIKNWSLYYQIITPTILFKYIDYLTLQILWKWACKRHYQKSKKWIKMKYFYKLNFINIVGNKNYFSLKNNFSTKQYKHQKIFFSNEIQLFNNRKKYKTIFYGFNKKYLLYFFPRNNIKYNISNLNEISKKILICLPNHTDIILIKHKLIQNDRSPFDGDFLYWITRFFYD